MTIHQAYWEASTVADMLIPLLSLIKTVCVSGCGSLRGSLLEFQLLS